MYLIDLEFVVRRLTPPPVSPCPCVTGTRHLAKDASKCSVTVARDRKRQVKCGGSKWGKAPRKGPGRDPAETKLRGASFQKAEKYGASGAGWVGWLRRRLQFGREFSRDRYLWARHRDLSGVDWRSWNSDLIPLSLS